MENEALIAARAGDLSKLKQRLDRGIKINAQDANGRTLLHHAASNGQREIVECLLQKDADVLLTTEKNNSALHIAVTRSDDALVKVILENVARSKLRNLLNAKTKATGTAALHLAAKQNSHAIVSILLEYGANFEIKNNSGEKPIDLATDQRLRHLFRSAGACFAKARRGDERLDDDLLECDVDDFLALTNCRNDEERTLLQVLVFHSLSITVTHSNVASPHDNLVLWRLVRSHSRDLQAVRESSRQDDVDELAERTRDCLRLYQGRQQNVVSRLRQMLLTGECRKLDFFTSEIGKVAGAELQKAHELLLMYRKMEDKDNTLKANTAVEILQEAFEAFGFDTSHQSYFHFEQLSTEWTKDTSSQFWFFMHLDDLIDKAIHFLLLGLSSAQMFRAVKNNDTEKMQHLMMDQKAITYAKVPDESKRTILSYAVENGSKKMIKLLLKAGVKVVLYEEVFSPIYLAVYEGRAKIVKLLLEKADTKDLPKLIDSRQGTEDTALHAAARLGRLDLVKMLLRYGATYAIPDIEGRTPLEVSTDEGVRELLKLVESCFDDAKDANAELIYKLKEMPVDLFLAVAGTRNKDGQTLAVVASKANAKSIAGMILRMIREAKGNKK